MQAAGILGAMKHHDSTGPIPDRTDEFSQAFCLATLYCHRARTPFSCIYAGSLVIEEFRRSDEYGQTLTLACAVMPDRAFWLFRWQRSYGLRSAVCQAKGRSALAVARARCRPSRLWEPAHRIRLITDTVSLLAARRFVTLLPVRKKLVARPEDYPLAWAAVPPDGAARRVH